MKGNFAQDPLAGQVLLGQSDGTYIPRTMHGDATIDETGDVTVSGGGGVPGGTDGELQWNNSGAFGGAGLTDGEHFAFGVGAEVDTATDPFSAGPASIIANINESPTGAKRTSGKFSTIDWEPTVDVASADSQPFNQNWATVNLDGQATENVENLTLYNVCYNTGDITPVANLVASTSESYNEGNANVAHIWGGSFLGEQDGNGTVSGELIGVISNVNMAGGNVGTAATFFVDNAQLTGGTIGQWAGVNIGGPNIAGATVANAYGMIISDIADATNNWSIRTGTGLVEFGDTLKCDKTIRAGTVYSVAGTALPNAATEGVGARAFVSDANAATFNTAYVGGGTNKVPVFSDGTVWRIG